MAGTETNAENESSNMSNISNSNIVAVIPVKPKNAEEFRTLCDALQRNDPNTTSISTSHLSMMEQGSGRDLGHALQRNTVVSEIELQLPYLVASRENVGRNDINERPKRIAARIASLLHWMEHSCSLRSVKIRAGWIQNLTEVLLDQFLGVLIKRQNILRFQAVIHRVSLSLLTPFLRANKSLQVLKIHAYTCPDSGSDDVFEDSARAVGALHQLEVLSITTPQIDPYLHQLPASPAFNTTLRELSLDYVEPSGQWRNSGMEFQASALYQVLCDRRCRLQRLELQNLQLELGSWTLLSSALLQSNPSSSLRALVLKGVSFSEEASALFFRDMQSNHNVPSSMQPPEQQEAPRLHHPLDLRLDCTFLTPQKAMKIGNMLCGSLLQHFTLNINSFSQLQLIGGGQMVVTRRQQQDFFDVLATRGTASCLQSMHLLNIEWNDLRRLAPYIATTVHLRHLTVQCADGEQDGVMPVPNGFLSGLRQNGSLHQVDLSVTTTQGERYTPNDANVRRIQTYTTRNRVLPQLMATTSFGSRTDAERTAAAAEAPTPPVVVAFPTLGAVAEHAPQMAPNNFLKSFLAASESLIPSQERGPDEA